jgi:sugar phosphate permease
MPDNKTPPHAASRNPYASPALSGTSATTGRPTRVRYRVILLLCLAAVASYFCRSLGPLDKQITAGLGLTNTELSHVMTAFMVLYAVLQIPSGWLAHRWGTRRTLAFLAVSWSAATVAAAAASGYLTLVVAWAANGAAQAGAFPCCVQAIGKWVPTSRRALACGSLTSCMSLGAAAAMYSAGALLAADLSWREILFAFAMPSAFLGLVVYFYFRDTPDIHPSVNPAELAVIHGAPPLASPPSTFHSPPIPWRSLLLHRDLWLICGQQFFRAGAYFFYLTWFPRYLREIHGLSESAAGKWASLPLAAVVVGNLLGGSLVDWLYTRTASVRLSRQAVAVFGVGLCGVLLCLTPQIRDPHAALALLAAATLLFGIGSPSAYTITIDKGGPYVTAVFAIMNTAGNIGAAVSPMVVNEFAAAMGGLLYVPVLLGGAYLAAAVCWLLVNPVGRFDNEQMSS